MGYVVLSFCIVFVIIYKFILVKPIRVAIYSYVHDLNIIFVHLNNILVHNIYLFLVYNINHVYGI